jgi:hypothetical protein
MKVALTVHGTHPGNARLRELVYLARLRDVHERGRAPVHRRGEQRPREHAMHV